MTKQCHQPAFRKQYFMQNGLSEILCVSLYWGKHMFSIWADNYKGQSLYSVKIFI